MNKFKTLHDLLTRRKECLTVEEVAKKLKVAKGLSIHSEWCFIAN